jgi:hypothetical protein
MTLVVDANVAVKWSSSRDQTTRAAFNCIEGI